MTSKEILIEMIEQYKEKLEREKLKSVQTKKVPKS